MSFFKNIRDDLVKQPIVEMAERYLAQGRYRNVLRVLKKGFDLDPDYPPYLWLAAQAEFHLENYMAVAECLDDLESQITRDALPLRYYYRGVARFRMGELLPAMADLTEAIRLMANSGEAYSYRGRVRLRLGHSAAAVGDLHIAETLLGRTQDLCRHLADGYLHQQKWQPALRYLKLIENPTVEDYMAKGVVWTALKEPREAIYCFTQVLNVKPGSGVAWCMRGSQHLALGMVEKAVEDLDRGLQLEPNRVDAYCDRAWALTRTGKLEAASRDLDRALALGPRNAHVYRSRAFLLMAQNRIQEMKPELDQAFRLNPTLPLLHYLQGEYYYQNGMLPEAIEAWHRSATLGEEEGKIALKTRFWEGI